ncbi:MAG: family 16 glycosylhydrolase [Roseomonas sp.]|nr:family 16 glycosylhydrolase [Roseomonas sp.]
MSATVTDPATVPAYYQPFFDSFDAGIVNFPDTWNVDTSVAGQITLHSPEYYLTSGMMEATGSADMGHGYGTYTINAMLEGIYPGSAIMLWNAPNEWPLSEIDIAETSEAGDGQQYAALHWDDNGQDRFSQLWYDPAIRPGVAHTYQAVWEPDRITMKVDGVTQAVFTVAVPKDFADGGWNHVFAFYNNKPETSLTVYDVKYEPLGTSTPALPPPSTPPTTQIEPAPAPAPAAGVVDWNGLAAAVEANWLLTGQWFIPEGWNADGTRTTTTATPTPDPTTPLPVADPVVDWEGLAAAVEANYAATGQWYIPDGWNADGTRVATVTPDTTGAWIV